jgi:hypothetical protein
MDVIYEGLRCTMVTFSAFSAREGISVIVVAPGFDVEVRMLSVF